MSKRRLKDEDLALWQKVADSAERLHPDAKKFAPKPIVHPKVQTAPQKSRSIPAFKIGEKADHTPLRDNLAPALTESLLRQPVQMDKKAFKKLRGGKLVPEGKIDLHGMTLDRAHGVLTRFILSSQGGGKRLVLVITGKGKSRDDGGPIPVRHGVLKHAVPQWLAMAPLAQAVLQITPAHVKHGGSGAYYVYLRRPGR